jgi:hypothetical protein
MRRIQRLAAAAGLARRRHARKAPPGRWATTVAAIPLAIAVTFVTTPIVSVKAGVTCWWPALTSSAQGDTFSDGATPSANVDVNECGGGQPGGPSDGRYYDNYKYNVSVSGKNESSVKVVARAWACGTPVYNQTRDWSYDGSLTTSWYDMGRNDGSECGDQYDLTVNITAWSGERWHDYQNESKQSCDEANSGARCPVGG